MAVQKKYKEELKRLRGQVASLKKREEELKRAEKILTDKEATYRAVVENQTELICRFRPDRTLTFVNEAYCRYFNKKRKSLIGRTFMPLIPKEDHVKIKENFARVSRSRPIMTQEHRVILSNGEIRWQKWTNMAIFDKKKKIIGYQAVGQDVTDLVRAKEELIWQKEYYENLVDDANVWVDAVDKEGRIVFWNKKAEAITGYTKKEVLGNLRKWRLQYPDPAYRKKLFKLVKKMTKGGRTIKDVETEVSTRHGEKKIIEWSSNIIRDRGGRISGSLFVGKDVTGEREAERKMKLAYRELQAANDKMKQLALKDPQTGLYNHRFLEEVIESEFFRARRYAHPFSVIMMDIDYFKSINDVYSHQFGDLVLQQFSHYLKSLVRQYDMVVRFSGEEFIVVSPGISRYKASNLAERLLGAINLYNFGSRRQTVKLKVSVAVVSYPDDRVARGMDLVDLAEEILSKVKEEGGNKVHTALDMKGKKAGEHGFIEESNNVKYLRDKIEKLTKRGRQSLTEAIFAFAKTIELKDHYTGEHGEKTVYYATEVAKELDLPQDDIEFLKQASILHDLGKIGVSEKILLKKSPLTDKEFQEIMKHPQVGADILRPIQFLHDLIPLILYHHEMWNGKGYPMGLKGEEIPIGARIIAVADVYQALTSNRPYRKAFPEKKALEIIKKGSGTQFDPNIVKIFLKVLKREKQQE